MPFALTIFLSAFLLFVVQLILGKFILPWFGGAPAVWTTCMLFFQILLLLGYAYAHLLRARLSLAKQVRVHIGLLAGSVLVLGLLLWKWGSPVLPSDAWKPESPEQPIWQILKLLAVSVGFPFFLLSATSPLLQQWLNLKSGGKRPYRLYALSNVGSLLGLLSYPFVIEPLTRLSTQGLIWGIGYLLFAAACAVCAVNALRSARAPEIWPTVTPREPTHPQPLPRGDRTSGPTLAVPLFGGVRGASLSTKYVQRNEAIQEPTPAWDTIALWLMLTAITSSVVLSVTNNLCQDVAVVPLLWVLPLAIYLLSFILCFESDRWYRRGGFVIATGVVSFVVLVTAPKGTQFELGAQILFYGLFLFLFCMTCHGELVRLKPGPSRLTLFYLMVALGGAIGGVFVGLVAPLLFKSYWEFHVTLLAGWIVLAAVFVRDKGSFFYTGDRWQFACFVLVISYIVLEFGLEFTPLRHVDFFWKHLLAITWISSAIVTLPVLAWFWRRPLAQSKYWPRIMVAGVILCFGYFTSQRMRSTGTEVADVRRNFYGLVRVLRSNAHLNGRLIPFLQLTHGQINHGIQFQDDPLRRQPVGYYSKGSGIELAFRLHPRRTTPQPLNVGVLGLGVGTLAAFAREGDAVRLYEINPAVSAYSAGPAPVFTYVRDCKGRAEIVLGDARLSLTTELRENRRAQFDILAMDAFSGDSVPAHLLTKEAFGIYLQHLRDENGIIAVNISNRFLDLRDLMFSLARHLGLQVVVIACPGNLPDRTSSRWCLLTKSNDFIQQEAIQQAQENYEVRRDILWTDDFSNLFQLLR